MHFEEIRKKVCLLKQKDFVDAVATMVASCPVCRETHDDPETAARAVYLTSQPECPVCMETEYGGPPLSLPCGHVFCPECAKELGFRTKPTEKVLRLCELWDF